MKFWPTAFIAFSLALGTTGAHADPVGDLQAFLKERPNAVFANNTIGEISGRCPLVVRAKISSWVMTIDWSRINDI